MTHSQLTQAGVAQSGVGRKFPSVFFASGRRTGQPAASTSMERWILELRIVPGHLESGSSELVPRSLRIFQGAATAALASQVQAGFYSTFSLWDEATSHLAPWALLS